MINVEFDNQTVGKNDFTDSVKAYYHDLRRYKSLSKEEEKKLIKEAQEGNIQSRNKVLTSYLRFVFDIAKKYRGRGVDIADLISEGNEGMIKAIDKFDVTRDVKFFTYAVWWIRQHMMKAIEIHNATQNKESMLDEVLSSDNHKYDNVFTEEEDESYSNDIASDQEEAMAMQEEQDQKVMVVYHLLSKLDDREQFVVKQYFGIGTEDEEQSLGDISKKMKICTERVRQLKLKALNHMRDEIFNIEEAEFLFR